MSENILNDKSTPLDFFIGIFVSILSSIMNAAGLNLLKLDHVKNLNKPFKLRKNECERPLWHLGLYFYIISQSVGNTIALNYIKAEWVAPLGAIALIFNFIFARILVKTIITRKDIIGTVIVIISVIWIVIFNDMNHPEKAEQLTIDNLKELMSRTEFIIYFSILNFLILITLAITLYVYWVLFDDRRKRKHSYIKYIDPVRLGKFIGMIMAIIGGLIASQTLLLAKSGVKLIYYSIIYTNQFDDALSSIILVLLAITAILQVYCLNTALKLHDSVLVVPMFYGIYTTMSISNSLIYLDQLNTYPPYALALVVIGVFFLIYGVKLLSQSKEDHTIVIKTSEEDDSNYTASNKFANIREEWMDKL
ncbi:9475_t:CDS:2, partial [Entrophospora sp. SA101]